MLNKQPVPYLRFQIALFFFTILTAQIQAQSGLDPTFGIGGKVVTHITNGSRNAANAITIQQDGKLVGAGSTQNGSPAVLLVRYKPDGSLDSTFGNRGIVVANPIGNYYDDVYSLAIQSDGKIIAAGVTSSRDINNNETLKALVNRYKINGTPDSSFANNGVLISDHLRGSDVVIITPLNRILIAGSGFSADGFAILQLKQNGSPDSSFGSNGKVLTPIDGGSVSSVVFQPDGKLVVAGAADDNTSTNFALARYKQNGTLDSTFGNAGITTSDFAGDFDYAASLCLQPDGKIVLAGTVVNNGKEHVGLMRYTSTGTADNTFGIGGKVVTRLSNFSDNANTIHLLANGKFLVSATAGTYPADGDFALLKYKSNGSLDSSLGTNGILLTDFSTSRDESYCSLIQPDGKPVLAGYTFTSLSSSDFALARYDVLSARWLGGVSSNWNDAANWSTGVVPTTTDYIIIPAGRTFSPVISGGIFYCKSLTLENGVSIIIKNDGKLIVTN